MQAPLLLAAAVIASGVWLPLFAVAAAATRSIPVHPASPWAGTRIRAESSQQEKSRVAIARIT
jgi:hypothetical protein